MAKKPTYKMFETLCRRKGGNLSEIAKALMVTRRAVQNWVNQDPKFKEFLANAREELVDLAEAGIRIKIQGLPIREWEDEVDEHGDPTGKRVRVFKGFYQGGYPDTTAMIYVLNTLGKTRGYVSAKAVEDPEGGTGTQDLMTYLKSIPHETPPTPLSGS